ncbi:hypothetical protein GCM10011508_14290 [Flavobacterium lutivivi]|nr:hypothetical protein GCM10011508_14290 [Flavobacterium lutivivi]
MIKKIIFVLIIFISIAASSQAPKLSNDATITVFTCGRGEELYSTFGHTALRVKDDANQLDVVFNYGTFDFRTENFYLKFVKGDLQYFLSVSSYEDFIIQYQIEKREVIEQTLNLTMQQKQKIFDALNNNIFSTDKYYTYKFIDRNCTTMVVDKINEILSGEKITKIDDKSISYRSLLYPYFENYFWYKLGINIIFGAKTDEKAEKLFLPVELMNSLNVIQHDNHKLVLSTKKLVNGETKNVEFSFFNSIYFVIFLLLLIVATNKNWVYKSFLFLCGLLGLFLCLVGLYSEHQEVLWNYNALLFNPLFLLLPFVGNKLSKRLIFILLAMIFIYSLFMFNKPHLVVMLPFIIVIIFMLMKLNGRNPLKLLTSVEKNSTQGLENNIEI